MLPRNFGFFPITQSFDIFDEMDKLTQTVYKSDTFYPPYNIYFENEVPFLEMAVTGFDKENLKFFFDDQGFLNVEGKKDTDENTRTYQVRKLSSKSFSKKFEIPKNVKVKTITVNNGLAVIEFEKTTPEVKLLEIQ